MANETEDFTYKPFIKGAIAFTLSSFILFFGQEKYFGYLIEHTFFAITLSLSIWIYAGGKCIAYYRKVIDYNNKNTRIKK